MKLTAPQPLHKDHDLSQFDCGRASINDWLCDRALQNQASDYSRTYVVCDEQHRVVAYYCLSAGSVARKEALRELRHGGAPDAIPVVVLGRFGVDKSYQRQGLGEDLLQKALERSAEIAEHIGASAVILHPLDKDVGRYYAKRGFKTISTEPPAMMVAMADIRAAFSQRSGD